MRSTLVRSLDRTVRRWWVVVALALIGLALGGIYAAAVPKTYSATSYVTVAAVDPANSQAALGFAQAFGRIATAPQVLVDASAVAAIPLPELASSARTSTSPDAPLIEITTRSVDAQRATNGANAIAGAFTTFGNARTPDTGMRVAILSPAAVPVTPSSLSDGAILAIGAGAGVLLGALAVASGIGTVPERWGAAPAAPRPASGGEGPRPSPRPKEQADEAAAQTTGETTDETLGGTRPETGAETGARIPEARTPDPSEPGTRPTPLRRRVDLEPTTERMPASALAAAAAGAATRVAPSSNGDAAPRVEETPDPDTTDPDTTEVGRVDAARTDPPWEDAEDAEDAAGDPVTERDDAAPGPGEAGEDRARDDA
ncbi:YveK family protein [Actinomycetospora cinnamomea]|uniref:Capsular polysaccharide biosynthesis protein n=1 Tax=Actinomycetospora cinnamomea TaxID=663609 RepID=A0A2U1EXC5_9PSEU|nr:Wzz/FepE/Etk N-terminal domain-containing protein [Actinomycetospora cinnamomea]PVZ04578.1 capsular polysaccharide biosynthesis protein [Actinomycetospora cinnamomea]